MKSAGASWTVQVKKGRKLFSQGVWAPAAHIAQAKSELEDERSTVAYAKKRAASAARREVEQGKYVDEFTEAVRSFLNFHERYRALAERLAKAIAAHATPVGSGTVARTKRIPVEQRAESAVIAWLRHQTTGYDNMHIERVKGRRREVRRMLAERSRELLKLYRDGRPVVTCALTAALEKPSAPSA